MRTLAVDPGLATGWVYSGVRLVDRRREIIPIAWGEDDPHTFAEMVRNLIDGHVQSGLDQVVCESWKPRGGPLSFQPDALELIGYLRHTCALNGIRFDVHQDPAFAHQFRDVAVKTFPLVGRGGAGHAKMALSHLWGWVQTADEKDIDL